MKTLSTEECSAWLQERDIREDPYQMREPAAAYVDQVRLPAEPWRKRAVVQQLLNACGPYDSALVQFTYWEVWSDVLAILGSVRAQHGDHRDLIESPGHLLGPGESDLTLGLVGLAVNHGFTAYLYLSSGTTVLAWEGELLDLWMADEVRFNEIQLVFEKLQLEHPTADA